MKFLKTNRAALVLVVLALVFLAIGVGRGETELVYRMAVNICTECIVLG